jgi:NAD(P)-dependent dehydrogenase (short-subunit alcohol dehydrogenase family)
MGRLDGKVAIVTGAATGLGREHALALAAEGAAVIVNNRVQGAHGAVHDVAAEIAAAGGTVAVDTASVADWEAMARLVARAVEEFGRLDIVVNNAGILVWEPVAEIGEAAYDELMAINLKGAFALTRHACAHWREASLRGERVSGRIINTASGVGLFGFPRGGLYGASKGATVSLTMVTAMEMRRHGVTANLIWPEARTRMGKGIFPEAPRGSRCLRSVRSGEHLAAGRLSGVRRRGVADRPGPLRAGRPCAADGRVDGRRRASQRRRARLLRRGARRRAAAALRHPAADPAGNLARRRDGRDRSRRHRRDVSRASLRRSSSMP